MNREKILVATDLTPRTASAVEKAIELAERFERPLEVLYVIPLPLVELDTSETHRMKMEALERKVQDNLGAINRTIEERLPLQRGRISVHTRVASSSNVAETIVRFIRERGISSLVLGDHREEEEGVSDRVFGTNLRQILHRCEVPALVVKTPPPAVYEHIFVPVDFTEGSRRALTYLLSLFPHSHFYLHHYVEAGRGIDSVIYGVLREEYEEYVASSLEGARQKMERFLESLSLVHHTISYSIVQSEFESGQVMEDAANCGATLLSVSVGDYMGTRSHDLIRASKVDVLVFRHDPTPLRLPTIE